VNTEERKEEIKKRPTPKYPRWWPRNRKKCSLKIIEFSINNWNYQLHGSDNVAQIPGRNRELDFWICFFFEHKVFFSSKEKAE